MTGVIYARYFSDNQREESIEGQLRECKAKTIFKLLTPILTVHCQQRLTTAPHFRKW